MKRHLLFLYLLAASFTSHAASWSDLWSTQDQQAQRLLDSGKPADAAGKFEDARRRAYAEIKAGQYADAAKRLEGFEDPQSQYNRANALARGGKLENSLAAYDSAIKRAPADSTLGRDARHNRELVAEQLKKQQSSQSKSGEQSDKKDQSQSGKQGNQSQKDERNASNGSQQQQKDQQRNQQGQGSQDDQSQQRQAAAQKPQDSQGKSASSQTEKEKQDAADAKRDAEAAMAQSKQDENAKPKDQSQGQMAQAGDQSKDQNGKPAAAAVEKPPSEQALALEQWLRQIPDDPSGLLRRKFLIEHMRRQQESGQ